MKKWPVLLLAIWLIATGFLALLGISFSGQTIIMSILEMAAGVPLLLAGKKVKVFHFLGTLLLAAWLIVSGLFQLLNSSCSGGCLILAVMGILAAILLVLDKKKITKRLSAQILAVWLVLSGLAVLLNLSFLGMGTIMSVLAVLAGIFLLMHKK